jgi:anti-anti-sigma regulatory factor
MAFQIFKRAASDDEKAKARSPGAANTGSPAVAPADTTLFAPSAKATGIDVAEEVHTLSDALQSAALLFANKQNAPALATLRDAVAKEDAKILNSWQCYLDLLRRANDRAGFDDAALKYVVQFERSAPSWDEMSTEVAAGSNAAVAAQPAFLTFPQALTGEKPTSVTALAAQAKRPKSSDARLSIDVRELQEFDVPAMLAFTTTLTAIRRQKWAVEWNGLRELTERMWKPLRAGEPKQRERWALGLELLIWMGREKDFEDRAVDFAVTFEQSPPSWEPPTADQKKWGMGGERAIKASEISLVPIDAATEIGASAQKLSWSGEMAGPNDAQLKRLLSPTQSTSRVEIEMKGVKHIDFVCAGAVSNGILRVMAAGRDVTVIGASPILRALLQITGVPENLFVTPKRTA